MLAVFTCFALSGRVFIFVLGDVTFGCLSVTAQLLPGNAHMHILYILPRAQILTMVSSEQGQLGFAKSCAVQDLLG